MNTQTQDTQTDYIPETAETSTGVERWRAARGKFRLGAGEDGTHQADRLHGCLKRIGRYEGAKDNGEPYENLEVDLELNGKLIAFKTDFTTLSTTGQLMRGLLDVSPGQLIIVEPWLGQVMTEGKGKGKQPTCISVYEGVVKDGKVVAGKRFKHEGDFGKGTEGRDALFALLKDHPCYKERERKQRGAKDLEPAWDCVIDAAHKHNWPALNQATEAAYLALANRVAGMAAVTEQLKAGGSPLAPYVNSAAVPATVWSIIATSIASNPASVAAELQPFVAKAVTL